MSLERFVTAQDAVWPQVERELKAGVKRTHWMWFVFPQIDGLGRSATARHFAIADLAEARAYLAHPVLGPRLRQAGAWLLPHRGRDPAAILGEIDAAKLRSSMTLFAAADRSEALFPTILDAFYDGRPCARTTEILSRP